MKKNTGARWEITVNGRPRTYGSQAGACHRGRDPNADVTVRDLEGAEETIVIQWQQPRGRQYH
jgi:hypothetical protein